MIRPDNKGKVLWDIFIFFITILAAVEIPLRIVLTNPFTEQFSFMDELIPVAFGLDIFLTFRTSLIINRRPVSDPRFVARHYLRRWFWVDLLAAIPLDLLLSFFFPASIIPAGSRVVRLLRLTHLIRLSWVVKVFNRVQKMFSINSSVLRLIFFVFWIVLIAHWVACGWMFLEGVDPTLDPLSTYIRSLYWTVTTLTTVGYGDITPSANLQFLYTMVVMILGVGIYGYVIGNISSLIANMDVARAHYKERMDRVNAFLKYRQLPPELSERIMRYYNYLWESRLGYDESMVLSDLPGELKTEVALYINKDIIEKVPLFKGAGDDLIREIVRVLKPVVSTPGDFIFRRGEMGSCMYFISRGQVEVVGEDDRSVIALLTEGSFFGEIALLLEQPRNASTRAADYCDLYRLDKEDFDRILEKYADFSSHIRAMVEQRWKEMGS